MNTQDIIVQIQQAGPMGLIKTILIIFFIYYAFKFLARLFAPFLMKKMADKLRKKAEQRFGNQKKEHTIKEGETIIDKKPRKANKTNDSVGDYVDFEEIE